MNHCDLRELTNTNRIDASIIVAQDTQSCDMSSREGKVLVPGACGERVIHKIELQCPIVPPEGIVKQGHDVALTPLQNSVDGDRRPGNRYGKINQVILDHEKQCV